MRVEISGDVLEVRLAWWQKILGLMRDIRIDLAHVENVQVVEEPLREVRRAGLMAGLRVPWVYYVARTIRLDEIWIVRRGVPAVSFSVRGEGALKRVVLCAPGVHALAQQLAGAVVL
jgi:hypothetical protein